MPEHRGMCCSTTGNFWVNACSKNATLPGAVSDRCRLVRCVLGFNAEGRRERCDVECLLFVL